MASKKRAVILFPCVGRRVALLESFRQACRRLGLRGVMVGTDSTEYSAALQCCDRKYIVPSVRDPRYRRRMTQIIRREKVDLLVPTVDLDLPLWASLRETLTRQGTTALISRPEVVALCQDKRKMFRFLRRHGFATPATQTAAQALRQKRREYPCFLKPWDGHASRGNYVAHNRQELLFYSRRVPHCLVQEFIVGQEHTVDVLVDFAGRVRCVVPRRRIEVRSGEVSKGQTIRHPLMIEQCRKLIELLGAGPGIITIQCFLTADDRIQFIEINPRFGGGVPLSIRAGADFPRWILQFWQGRRPRIQPDGWQDRLLMLRYDEAVWVAP
ncbi:MAG: ATP-grasp domain-containing protein [Sedimentisphaerales bacterium]|nr:ATP-grasp domain-containing protein [Sedimentisphaerales bacterium]